MDINQYAAIPEGGGLILFGELQEGSWKFLVTFVYGLDQAAKILQEQAPGHPDTWDVLTHFADCGLPSQARRLSCVIAGSAATTIVRMSLYFGSLEDDRQYTFAVKNGAVVGCFFPEDPPGEDAVLGLRDDNGIDQIFVFYSKEQARDLVVSLDWLSENQHYRLLQVVHHSSLPEESCRDVITIEGTMARYINQSFATEMRLTPDSIN